MIAPLAGVAVVAGPLLGQAVGLADGGVQVDSKRPVAGSGPSGPGPSQQLAAHTVQLADLAPAEAAQEGTVSGGRLDHAAQHPPSAAGTQRVGVVNAVAPSQGGGHQGHKLVSGVGPARGIAQVQVMVNQFPQAQAQGQGGGQKQPSIRHEAVIVEGDLDAVRVVAW